MCGQHQSIKGLTGTRSWKGKIRSLCFSWVSVFSWSQTLNLLVVRLSDSDWDLCQWLPWFSGLWVWAEMVSLVILGLPPPYRWQIMGLLNLQNHVWQSFRRNFFLNISPSLYPSVSVSSENPDQYIRFVRMSVFVMCVTVSLINCDTIAAVAWGERAWDWQMGSWFPSWLCFQLVPWLWSSPATFPPHFSSGQGKWDYYEERLR